MRAPAVQVSIAKQSFTIDYYKEEITMMIKILHLLWIVPISGLAGFLLAALLGANGREG